MNATLRRFRGALVALIALGAVGATLGIVDAMRPKLPTSDELKPMLYRFEKDDLVGAKIVRPDQSLELTKVEGEWLIAGQPWRPARSMTRKIAHQLHDLTARAEVIEHEENLSVYGLGEDAIHVLLTMRDGDTHEFEVGDPNPTSVSFYIRPLPAGRVFVVKKSSMDFWRVDIDAFRETKFATFDADDAVGIDATVDSRQLSLHRTGELTWEMTAPVTQRASRDAARMMLGRVAALTAQDVVQEGRNGLVRLGADPPKHIVRITMATGDSVTLHFGDPIPETDPSQSYVYSVEEDAVFVVKDGLLDAYRKTVEEYRNEVLFPGNHEWTVERMVVRQGTVNELALERTSDGWRWPDGQSIPGSTPKRVAGAAADLRAVGFHDVVPKGASLEVPTATVVLTFQDGNTARVDVGSSFDVMVRDRTAKRSFVRIEGDPTVYEVDGMLSEVCADLFREYGRKTERDAERHLDLAPSPPVEPAAPSE